MSTICFDEGAPNADKRSSQKSTTSPDTAAEASSVIASERSKESRWARGLLHRLLAGPWARPDDRYEHFIAPSMEDYPVGYPRLAALVNSDSDTLLFRRFGWLRCRAMLHIQDELRVLEERLMDLDQRQEKTASHRLISRRIDESLQPRDYAYTRSTLMNEIKLKLKEYDDLALRQDSMSSMPKPSKAEFSSYFDWMYNDPPVVTEEFAFIYHKDDFMSLGQQADSWLGPVIEGLSSIMPQSLKKLLLSTKADRAKTTDPNTTYYSSTRWETLVKVIVNVASIMLLFVPTVLLYVLNITRGQKLAILVIFVTTFNVSLTALTRAKRHEVFEASAAYCAVLVVFLGTISQPSTIALD